MNVTQCAVFNTADGISSTYIANALQSHSDDNAIQVLSRASPNMERYAFRKVRLAEFGVTLPLYLLQGVDTQQERSCDYFADLNY